MKTPKPRTPARFWQWYFFHYLPHTVIGWFVTRPPIVYSFNCASDSWLIRQLCSVNTLAPTKICRVMTKHGSDKGRRWHNYTTVYSVLFNGYLDKPVRIFELGLGTNNPDLVSSMGSTGRPGASLRGWRELFPLASVYGADIDRSILFRDGRIKTFYCNQLDQASIRQLWAQPDLQDGVDILIEDGLHTLDANISFLEGSIQQLRPGGIYIVEDISADTIEKWRKLLETTYSKRYSNYEFALIVLPSSVNQQDNNLLIVRRKS